MGLFSILQTIFVAILTLLHLSPQLSSALCAGLFEMTLGAQTAAESSAELLQKLMIISFILGWSGFSVQAQVSSILSAQQISARLYCLCRPLQGLLAALYIPALLTCFPQILSIHVARQLQPFFAPSPYLPLLLPLIVTCCLLCLSAICHVWSHWLAHH
jgi:nucleoside recognition membrane protein YjiH